MPALRKCATPGCPELTAATRCPDHQAERERARGTRKQRGYNHAHDKLRAQYAARITNGEPIACVRCGQRITTPRDLDLGHTDDRAHHSGPEHAHCNRSEAGRKSHRPGPA